MVTSGRLLLRAAGVTTIQVASRIHVMTEQKRAGFDVGRDTARRRGDR